MAIPVEVWRSNITVGLHHFQVMYQLNLVNLGKLITSATTNLEKNIFATKSS